MRPATSVFVGATHEAMGLLFGGVEGEAPAGPRAGADRDLSIDAAIIDALDAAAPPPASDPLRGLRRAVARLAARRAAGGGAHEPPSPPPSPPAGAGRGERDELAELAQALAALLAGTGARVALRAPRPAPAAAAGRGAGAPAAGAVAAAPPKGAAAALASFVMRGRFLVVKGPNDTGDDAVIIDPSFRDVFTIAPATPGYRRLVESLPEVFVGDAHALRRVAAIVSVQAARSYAALCLGVPPWRRYGAVVARWLPRSGGGGGGAPPRAVHGAAPGTYDEFEVTPPGSPLSRLGSGDAAALAAATAGGAARGALARLTAVAGDDAGGGGGRGARVVVRAAPARVVSGFELPPAPVAAAV